MISDIFSAIAALIFVLALMALVVWMFKRAGLVPGQMARVGKAGKQITVVETRILDARNRLVIVRWRGREYLLGSGANGVTTIGTHDSEFEKLLDTGTDDSTQMADAGNEKA